MGLLEHKQRGTGGLISSHRPFRCLLQPEEEEEEEGKQNNSKKEKERRMRARRRKKEEEKNEPMFNPNSGK